ncbi:MAG: hypothetical protein ACE5GC_03170 [Acidimicrobiia bacterium]
MDPPQAQTETTGAARRVTIGRPVLRISRPTTYRLLVDIRGKLYSIPFAEHWMLGTKKLSIAQAVAADLDIPVVDPGAERDAGSRLFFIRWMGRGEEWKLALVILAGFVVIATVYGISGGPP